jgi:hypothetical protein
LWWLIVGGAIVLAVAAGALLVRVVRRKSGSATFDTLAAVCPHCQKRLRLPVHAAGKKVRCSGCATTFVA